MERQFQALLHLSSLARNEKVNEWLLTNWMHRKDS